MGSPAGPRGRFRPRGLLIDLAPLRADPQFRLIWAGQALSNVGTQASRLALPYQLYVLTDSTLAIGLLAALQLVPTVAAGLGAGTLVDAFDRRKVLLVANLAMAANSLALLVLALTPSPPLVLLYACGMIWQGLSSIDQPARFSALPRLVPPERLSAAISLNQVSTQASSIIGPALGGVLLAVVGPAGAYAADVLSFGAVIAAVVAMRPIPPLGSVARPGLAAVREGLRFAGRRRVILSTFVVDLNAMIFGMPTALFPALALTVFDAGPAGVGALAAAPAAGAFVAALLSGWIGGVRRLGRTTIGVIAVWGAAIALFGASTFSFALAWLFLAVAGGADVLSAVARATIVQLETPDELRGRVGSLHIMVVRSGPRLGDMYSSTVAAAIGPQLAVFSGGLICLAGLGLVVRAFPELAAYARPPAAREAAPA